MSVSERPKNGKNGSYQPRFKLNRNELGYVAVNRWPEATPENAMIEALNPELQAEAEEILWSIRQSVMEPSPQ